MTTARIQELPLDLEDPYRSLLDDLPDAVLIHVEGEIRFANRAAAELVGAGSAACLIGRSVLDFVPAENRAEVRLRIARQLAGQGGDGPLEDRVLRLDGSELDAEIRFRPTRYGGRPALQLIVRDLSESKSREQMLDEIQRLAGLGSWEARFRTVADVEHDPQEWSDEIYRILGVARGSVVPNGRTFVGLIHPEDREKHRRIAIGSLRGEERYDIEYRIVRPDGEIRFVRGRARVQRSAAAEGVHRLIGTLQDMTESERSRRALERYAAELASWKTRHEAVVRASGQVLYSWNVQTNEVRWTGAVRAVLGYETLPATLEAAFELIHPDDHAPFEREIDRSLRECDAFRLTYRFRHADGRWIVLEDTGSFIRDEAGRLTELVGFTMDVTAKREAEEAERRSTERFRNLFEGLPLGLYRTTPDGHIEDVNPAFVRITGYPDAETLMRLPVSSLYLDPDQRAHLREQLAAHGTVRGYGLRVRRYDGGVVETSVSARVVRDEAGRITGYEGIVEDVSERRSMEQELLRARDAALAADRLKTIFLANMSHEIRTPLNAILGLASLVAEHLESRGDDSQSDAFAGIERSGRRLLRTIHGILDLARMEADGFGVAPRPLDVAATVRRVAGELAPEARAKGLALELRIEVEPELPFDGYCLSEALIQLLDNAIKFTDEGGVFLRLHRDEHGVALDVTDTGVGIAPASLGRIFEPFTQEDSGYSRRFEGSGLGLTLARRYCERSGAVLEIVESVKGRGSTFRIRFAAPGARAVSLGRPPEETPAEEHPKP
jgi:PAS domain S-box-containing protein